MRANWPCNFLNEKVSSLGLSWRTGCQRALNFSFLKQKSLHWNKSCLKSLQLPIPPILSTFFRHRRHSLSPFLLYATPPPSVKLILLSRDDGESAAEMESLALPETYDFDLAFFNSEKGHSNKFNFAPQRSFRPIFLISLFFSHLTC